jgi:hypothetical protein
MANLVELCPFHHRLVHVGGRRMTFDGVEAVRFESPDGFVVEDDAVEGTAGGSSAPLAAANARWGVAVTAETVVPCWYGERLDLDLAITALTPRNWVAPVRRA